MTRLSRALIREVMAQMGSKGGKRSLETMTHAERVARAKKASLAAAQVNRRTSKVGQTRKSR